jgi:hypothetical protein
MVWEGRMWEGYDFSVVPEGPHERRALPTRPPGLQTAPGSMGVNAVSTVAKEIGGA